MKLAYQEMFLRATDMLQKLEGTHPIYVTHLYL